MATEPPEKTLIRAVPSPSAKPCGQPCNLCDAAVSAGSLATGIRARNTAEPSGELSVGDLVAVGEAALICDRAGWVPLRGGITEACIDEHGTHPLPGGRPGPAGPAAPTTGKGDHHT
jgi:hypothetical protein